MKFSLESEETQVFLSLFKKEFIKQFLGLIDRRPFRILFGILGFIPLETIYLIKTSKVFPFQTFSELSYSFIFSNVDMKLFLFIFFSNMFCYLIFVAHLINNSRISLNLRNRWILSIVIVGPISLPVYFFKFFVISKNKPAP